MTRIDHARALAERMERARLAWKRRDVWATEEALRRPEGSGSLPVLVERAVTRALSNLDARSLADSNIRPAIDKAIARHVKDAKEQADDNLARAELIAYLPRREAVST